MQCQVEIGDPLVSGINSVCAPFGLCTFCSSGFTMQCQVKIGDPLVSGISSVSVPFGLCNLLQQWTHYAVAGTCDPLVSLLKPLGLMFCAFACGCSGGFTMLSVRYSRDIDTELQWLRFDLYLHCISQRWIHHAFAGAPSRSWGAWIEFHGTVTAACPSSNHSAVL